jgi:arginine decarboxylase
MIESNSRTIKSKALLVDDSLTTPNTAAGKAALALASSMEDMDIVVKEAISADDAMANIISDTSIHVFLISWELDGSGDNGEPAALALLRELRDRHDEVPVFLLADSSKAIKSITEEVMSLIDEFVWMLEDTASFIAGRVSAAVVRYREQLLPPYTRALARYSRVREESFSAPGHQGGMGFTKRPVGRAFFDFYGEALFRTDMGIERSQLGSLLDHTGPVRDSEEYASQVFGAHRSYNGVVGTSGSNRTIMQACMKEDDVVICDRNCHKSIEQGLILTGALPVYMVPTRNRYGIIGPIHPDQMTPQAIKSKMAESPLMQDVGEVSPVYSVLTNCTYDGLCYNAVTTEGLLAQSSPRVHFDEAWYGYARFNPIYEDHFAMRGDPADHDQENGPTVFATHSTHKLLTALSQGSYIHVRNGRHAIRDDLFNQSYMMHTTTSPLYAIVASNDIASAMMDGPGGTLLTTDVIREAVDFRQAVARSYANHTAKGDWFFKPWNAEEVTDPATGETFKFHEAPAELLVSEQDCWRLHPDDTWHGFEGLTENYCMLDPIKVSLLTPGMGEDGNLLDTGVPAELFTAYVSRLGFVPTRTTDFQVMFLFSVGITKGKWATLINTLLSFKRLYDANTPLSVALPELVAQYPDRYGRMGLKTLGDEMFDFLKEHEPGRILNDAYSSLPEPVIKPRNAYQHIVDGAVELVPAGELEGRVAANSVMPYPPGIPMLMSGENFGAADSPQINYLKILGEFDARFPGFEHEVEGAEVVDGIYSVMCLKR